MTMINPETFQTDFTIGGTDRGTVEVTIRNETRRVPATRCPVLGLRAYGITGRYLTGKKAWPGYIMLRDGIEHAGFGFDSRFGKHRKTTISFAS